MSTHSHLIKKAKAMNKLSQLIQVTKNVMKSTVYQLVIAIIFSGISLATDSNAPDILNTRISLKVKDARLSKVLGMIEKRANVKFVYVPKAIGASRHISANIEQELLSEALDKLFTPLHITYKVVEDRIILNPVKGTIPLIEKDSKSPTLPQVQDKTESILNIDINGTVTDATGSVLTGVSVIIKNSTKGTITNENGNFSIDVPNESAVLIFSFVGYQSKEITVGAVTRIDVQLAEDDRLLEEVVVVGYSSQRKKDITGAVAIVDMKALKAIPAGSALQALQGQASGVNVINSGRPGAASTVFIRGISSFEDTKPLVIVDGVQSSLDNISANDVESMQVLKDAGAAAIYGVRGSNGVIIVTTKKREVR